MESKLTIILPELPIDCWKMILEMNYENSVFHYQILCEVSKQFHQLGNRLIAQKLWTSLNQGHTLRISIGTFIGTMRFHVTSPLSDDNVESYRTHVMIEGRKVFAVRWNDHVNIPPILAQKWIVSTLSH